MSARAWRTPGGERHAMYKDMLNQPHLLICGCTGSGKSTLLDGLIYTALYKFPGGKGGAVDKANSVEFILIDPKSRLGKFEHLPHTVRYEIAVPGCLSALNYAVSVMMERFDYNRRNGFEDYPGSHLYVIIDEFYPLVLTKDINKNDVISAIGKLGALGRAAKVHVILCTQKPTSDVIPTIITVNFDARVGLRTRDKRQSWNIIEQSGCENLPRFGQGYYMTPEGVKLYNIPMIEQEELDARVKWWTDQKPKGLLSRLFSR